jgi:hypothetical protein
MDVTPMLEAGDSPIADIAAALGTDGATYTRELPAMSAFALEDGVVHLEGLASMAIRSGVLGARRLRRAQDRGGVTETRIASSV